MGRNGATAIRAACFWILGAAGAHALTYSWKPSAETYTPATGAPLTFSAVDNGYTYFSLPFPFTYDSLAYSSVSVGSNGLLVLGSSSYATYQYNDYLFNTFSPFSVLAPWWDDLSDDATAVVDTITQGTAPNRVFVVQYANYPDFYYLPSLRLNWQVRLYEGSNRIQFVYGSKNAGTSSTYSTASVGIKGRINTTGFYFEGTTGSRTVPNYTLNSNTGFPAAGTVFTFAPDTAAPLGLIATSRPGAADLVWRRTRLTSLQRYRIWAGTSPTTMTVRDSTASLSDTTFTLSGLTNGTRYYVGVTVVGPGGEESGFAQVVTVTPTQPPTVSIASPASGYVVAQNGSVTFTASANDPDGTIARVEYYRDGATLIASSTIGTSYSATWYPTAVGSYSITARAYDNAGAVTVSAPITVIVNAVPVVTLTAPPTGTLLAPGASITLTATASDADGSVDRVEFLRDGLLLGSALSAPYAYTWTGVPSGRYLLTARAVDDRGATATSFSSTLSVTTPPSIAISAPAAGSLVHSAGGYIAVTANATDADGTVARVDYYRGTTFVGSSTTGNPFSVNAAAVTGAWTLTARATDNLGAIDTSDAVAFTVNLSPTVSLTSPYAGAYALGTAINLTASVYDGDGTVSLVEFFHDGVKIGEDNTSPYGLSWTPDTAGRYVLTVRATDNSGGSTVSAQVIITLSSPPQVSFISPTNGFIRLPSDSLVATASDSDGTVSRVEFYNGSVLIGSATTGNPYRFLWYLPGAGDYILVAKAIDNLGVASKPDTLRVSTVNVRITSPAPFSAFATNSSIAITARAWAPRLGGSLSRVEFYRDSVLIGSSTGPGPDYAVTWNAVPTGRYRLQARAVDNLNTVTYSQAVTVFVNDSAKALLGGRLFVTGHDADAHGNLDFMSAALDYLMFGKAAGAQDLPIKKGARIAFLGDVTYTTPAILEYNAPTFINVAQAGWDTVAFSSTRPFDVLMVGSGYDYLSGTGSVTVNAQRAKFEDYFNHGGGILAFTEQGIGQSYYDFLPSFGTAQQQSIGSVSGVFTATPAGLAIGLTEEIVDRDLTHTEFLNVDSTVFRTFEFYNADTLPVSIGTSAVIDSGGGYVPQDSIVADPQAIARDSVFLDTLCIRFESATPGAIIYLTTDGGDPDSSSWTVASGTSVCIDSSAVFRAIAKKPGWLNSAVKQFRFRRSDQVAMPLPDSLPGYFQSEICVRFTSATPDAIVHYTLDGGLPDTSGLAKPNGDSICLDTTAVIRIIGRKTGMRDSDTASYTYTRMQKLPTPTLDKPDSTRFADSLCFAFSAMPGSHIAYTLDGGDPDTSGAEAHPGDSLCVDRSVSVRLIAERTNYIKSDENAYRYFKMDTAAAPVSNRTDSTWFADTLCLVLTSATPGAAIHYTVDGSRPDTSSPVAPGGALCVDRTATVRAIAALVHRIDSPVSSYTYRKMDTLAPPAADPPDATDFSGSLCIHFSTNSAGASLRYSMDGSDPASSSLVLPMADSLCIDGSATVRARAEKANWIPSPEASFTYRLVQRVARPTASRVDSAWFADTLCVRFATATDSAVLHYLLGPGKADTSSLTILQGANLCTDRSVEMRVAATRPGWLPSDELVLRFFKMDTAAVPTADPGDSTWFAGSRCIRLSTATPGAGILFTTDGGDPGVSGRSMASGDTLCIDDTATVRAIARKTNFVDSRQGLFHYIRMRKAAAPIADTRDSIYFADSICVRFSAATPGADLRYTSDGTAPDTASPALPPDGRVCADRAADLRVIATLEHWIPSDPVRIRVLRMDTAAVPVPEPGDSTWFAQSACVRWTTATPGAVIRVTTDGSAPDSSSRTLAGGDTLCVDRTATVRASAAKRDWITSPDTSVVLVRMVRAARPEADKADSTWFPDRLCIRYTSATEGARIRYVLDGGRADTSGLSVANGDTVCVDRSSRIEAIAVREHWLPSDALDLDVFRMEAVAEPEAGVPDSTWFRNRLCVPWSTATPGAAITVRRIPLDGDGKPVNGKADTAGRGLASGDSVCLDRSAELRAVGSLDHWKDSPEAVRSYFRMDTVAKPVFAVKDTLFYPSTCVTISTPTPGADIRYTLDGGAPDTSGLVKHGGDTVCTDRSVKIRAVGVREHSVNSGEASVVLKKMPQVAPLVSSIGDSAVFARRVCFTLSSKTDSVRIRYTLGGGDPLKDTLSLRNGDSLCLERSAELVAVGTRPLWRNSTEIRVSLEVDNDPPRLVKAEKRPYSIRNLSVSGNCRGIGQDTLRVEFSEPLFPRSKPPRWDRLLVFSPSCDTGKWLPVKPSAAPVISGGGKEAIILLDNNAPEEKPKLGNCLSLDWESKEFPDRVGNPPDRHGVRIEGRENAAHISGIRAYPPVVGLDQAGTSGGCSDERVEVNTWIPPVGFDPKRGVIDPQAVRNCAQNGAEAAGRRESIPPCMSIVEVISDGPYVADIRIFDQLGTAVNGSRQRFGACGELDNLDRSVAGKKRSYLVWNTRDREGARAGNGAYVWRISFRSEKHGMEGIENVVIRTGFLRGGACSD